MENEYYPFINLPLPYNYYSLEPFIDTHTMYLHHRRHLQTYIDNLNKILEEHPKLQHLSLQQLIRCSRELPDDIRDSVRNNAGGVYNHRFYFNSLTNPVLTEPFGTFSTEMKRTFGDYESFKKVLKDAALSVFGSGYAWVVAYDSKIAIITTANQNTPLEQDLIPLLNIDVWEHAYYLKHHNVRANYIDNWFKIINWQKVEDNYLRAVS